MGSKIFAFFLIIGCFTADLQAGVLFSGSDGGLSASANFTYSNSILTLTLTNTSTSTVTSSNQILTGVFFNVKNVTPTVTSASASATKVIYGSAGTNVNVSSDWAYEAGGSSAPFGMAYGLSSESYGGLFSNSNTLAPGGSLATGSSVNYGITTSGTQAQKAPTWANSLIQNSVVFTFDIPSSTGFTTSDITAVAFQYGSALTSSDFEVLPEPSTYAGVLSLTLLALVLLRSRQRDKQVIDA